MTEAPGLDDILRTGRVLAVVTIERAVDAVPLARALVAGGLRVIEVTLRTRAALAAIERIAADVQDAIVGAGTARSAADLRAARAAGALFAVSPGFTPALDAAAIGEGIPWLPGVATASEAMLAHESGRTLLKFFPAEAAGGPVVLRAFATVFPETGFCPTGGVAIANLGAYLALPNVVCVGGSWVAPPRALAERDWSTIQKLAVEATTLANAV